MSETLTLKTQNQPTVFNKEMVIGTFLVPIPIIGSVIGGMVGKRRMEQENVSGKTVSNDPSRINKDAVLGGLLGLIGGSIASNVLVAAAVMITGAPVGAAIGAAAVATWAAGGLIGAAIGSNHGVKQELHEFKTAKNQHQSKNIAHAVAQAMEHQMGGHEVSHDHVKKLEAQRAHTHEHAR